MVNAIAMTAADLSASAKPWEIQTETVKGIFEEFYEQGDEERRAGRQPMAMMDRFQPDQQAFSQVTHNCFIKSTPYFLIIPFSSVF